MIIGISGKFGTGKDTAALCILEEYPDYHITPIARALKEICARLLSTPVEFQYTREGKATTMPGHDNTVGRYQQLLGMKIRELFGEDIWVNITINDPKPYKIITDVRFPNEVAAIERAGGIIIRLERQGVELNDGRDPMHISETALDDYPFQHVIKNNGTIADLKDQLMQIIS